MEQREEKRPPKRLSATTSGAIVDALGGTNAVAKICGIRPASVSEWRSGGMPRAWVLFLRERFRTIPIMKSAEILDF